MAQCACDWAESALVTNYPTTLTIRTEEDPPLPPPLADRADPAAVAAAAPAMFCRVRDDVWLTRRSPVAASLDSSFLPVADEELTKLTSAAKLTSVFCMRRKSSNRLAADEPGMCRVWRIQVSSA